MTERMTTVTAAYLAEIAWRAARESPDQAFRLWWTDVTRQVGLGDVAVRRGVPDVTRPVGYVRRMNYRLVDMLGDEVYLEPGETPPPPWCGVVIHQDTTSSPPIRAFAFRGVERGSSDHLVLVYDEVELHYARVSRQVAHPDT